MTAEDNVDLAPFMTFGIHRSCAHLITVSSVAELAQALEQFPHARILGGGSNILLTNDLKAPVIRIDLRGILALDGGLVQVAAGERWHDLVTWCVRHDLGGLENLALIPGTVGAAPMQNIGAYGVEQERCFVELQAMHRTTREIHTFDRAACEFGYRESIFKGRLRDQYVIVRVTYRLSVPPHRLNISYKDLSTSERFSTGDPATFTIKDVYDEVVNIRTHKLPDPAVIGNAGSFFKNPVVDTTTAERIASEYENVPVYPQADGTVKLAAAWLIDQCGWKGVREGAIGVHDRQALVLVNHGGANGADLIDLAHRIQHSVRERFGVELVPEVNVW